MIPSWMGSKISHFGVKYSNWYQNIYRKIYITFYVIYSHQIQHYYKNVKILIPQFFNTQPEVRYLGRNASDWAMWSKKMFSSTCLPACEGQGHCWGGDCWKAEDVSIQCELILVDLAFDSWSKGSNSEKEQTSLRCRSLLQDRKACYGGNSVQVDKLSDRLVCVVCRINNHHVIKLHENIVIL